MKAYVVLLLLVMCTPIASCNMSDMLDIFTPAGQVDDITDLVYVESLYKPDLSTEKVGHIIFRGDILGFKDVVKHNNTFYSGHNPEIIYLYSIDHDIEGKRWFNYNVDTLTSTETITYNRTHAIVTVNVFFKYHHSKLKSLPNGRKKIQKTYYTEQQTFTMVEQLPCTFPQYDNVSIEAIYYNNSIQPKTLASVPDIGLYQKIVFSYKNESLVYRNYAYNVEYTDSGIPYGNITPIQRFDMNKNKAILSFKCTVWIPGVFDNECITVTAYSPYNSTISHVNTTEHTDLKTDIEWISIISVIMPILIIYMICIVIKI